MFKKKKCPKCGEKIEEKYSFCPYCGFNADSDEDEDNFGMLGKNDFMNFGEELKLPFGFNNLFNSSLFNSIIKNLSKELDEQLRAGFEEKPKPNPARKDGISISISTFGNNAPKIKVTPLGNNRQIESSVKKFKQNNFTAEKAKIFSKLKRIEPKTSIRRLADKVIYEIEMPGVKSAEDVSVIRLENSIEIKAIGKDKAYSKIIPLNLPIVNYNFSEGRLVIEFAVKN
jgi:hypothetical protein